MKSNKPYQPQLYIDTHLVNDQQQKDEIFVKMKIGEHSITPTTCKSIKLESNNANLFTEEYDYLHNQVVRYGINASNINLDQSSLGDRISVNMSAKPSTFKQEVKKVSLHTLEKEIIIEARKYLYEKDENKTVLIDIFERVDGQIMIDNNGIPKTHTVVLYKAHYSDVSNQEIYVIDPSNSRFSAHLGNILNIKVYDQEQKKIYKPTTQDIGPKSNQFRDCIDIAVKIAFALSAINSEEIAKLITEKQGNISVLYTLDTIQELTNQQDINKNLLAAVKESVVRVRQASDNVIRKDANNLLTDMDKLLKFATSFSSIEKKEQIQNEVRDKLFLTIQNLHGQEHHKDAIKQLKTSYKEIKTDFLKPINLYETQLVGQYDNNNLVQNDQVELQGDHHHNFCPDCHIF